MTDLALPVGPRDHMRGAADGVVTLVEYADVECPYCRRLAPVLQQVLARRPRVGLVYRHLPLVREHPFAYSAALALEAAAQQGRFWELHDRLLAEPAHLGRSGLVEHATQLGLDPAELLRPASEQHDAKVREDFQSGIDGGAVSAAADRAAGFRPQPQGVTAAARRYLYTEAGGAVLLLLATVVAVVWANSPWSGSYEHFWETPLSLQLGDAVLSESLRHWVNDLLMALFFLLVGLEIARELAIDEYRDRRAVTAPALAALGGLVVPAALFFAVVGTSGASARGWGIAISTDTASALGVLALVGPRCPNRLRIFLLALAIVDDIAAIGVIAVFYTYDLQILPLSLAGVLLVAVAAARRFGLQNPAPYVLLALALWLATYASGVHPTVAGVGLGLLFAAYPPREDALAQTQVLGRQS